MENNKLICNETNLELTVSHSYRKIVRKEGKQWAW